MKRLPTLDVLRSVAITCVLICHYGPAGFFWGSNLGVIGVPLFFVCSGFLITFTTDQKENLFYLNIKDFYVRRIARILPLLILTVWLGLIILNIAPLTTPLIKTFYLNSYWIFAFTPFLNNWFSIWAGSQEGVNGIIGVFWGLLWTLACELQFYLGFPHLLRRAGTPKQLNNLLVLIVLVGWATNLISFWHVNPFWWRNSLSAASFIAIGVLVSRFSKVNKPIAVGLTAIGAGSIILCYGFADYNTRIGAAISPAVIGTSAGVFLYGLINLKTKAPKLFCFPGRICYGLYLWHPFALFFAWKFGPLVYAALSLALALVSYYIFEKPFNRKILQHFLPPLPVNKGS